ncbi:glutamine-hydrolyzing GMP synthase [Treponema medium]|uniref:glutamine-hydrolyzing GMP synthase n=1 Tax=Treponema medium TaxID=58231 RepID=UPI00197FC4C3|nr:glutamine-hydrolyzing GMP synthase [Treponema medium]QSH92776.1 glutamine-hydrolyzing GMP synthase [Treponema medium]
MHTEKIIILDFGGQYSQLIARRVRECGVYCEVLPFDAELSRIQSSDLKGIILTGAPDSVYAEDAATCNPEIFNLKVPVLGICYGMQLMTYLLGGKVQPAEKSEFGKTKLYTGGDAAGAALWKDCPADSIVWMSHNDSVSALPEGFTTIAHTDNCPIAAMVNTERKCYGVQFHPEVLHSVYGTQMLKNFVRGICGCTEVWNAATAADSVIQEIKRKVGNKKVISALSGGVDSSVASVLVHKAVGDQLTCIFVDHGLLRKDEAAQVLKTYRETLGLNIIHVDASERFLKKLAGVTEPERKRKIIGEEFIRVFEEEAKKIGTVDFLVQGTIYPDVIESGGSKKAAVIKSHHNVGGLPEHIDFKELIEPLRMLFKDEVRALGTALGIPDELVKRQPFPGPGLAVRILGEITPERLHWVRESDAILREEIAQAGLADSIWQYFTVFPNVRTVGAMGDGRTYDNLIAIRAVTSVDAMTVEVAEIPYPLLQKITLRIINEVKGINRVVYDITPKPPATIEWE